MIQFYLLTIVFLTIGALILLTEDYGQRFPTIVRLRNLVFSNQTNTIVLLVLTAVTGILKMISPVGPGPAVLGDFFPAVMLLCVALFYGFEMKSLGNDLSPDEDQSIIDDAVFIDSELVDKAEGFYYKNKKLIGYITLGIAFFHFMFPAAVLL